jgi:hypothetical protein
MEFIEKYLKHRDTLGLPLLPEEGKLGGLLLKDLVSPEEKAKLEATEAEELKL